MNLPCHRAAFRYLTGVHYSMTRPYSYAQSTALITGASRGIGAALARLLAARGVPTLVLTARNEGDLLALATEIKGKHGTRVEVVVADLADGDAPAAIKRETDRRGLCVDLLINNAGFGTHGLFDETDARQSHDMITVNVEALVALTHEYLPAMIATNRGSVVNIASTASFQAVPFMSVYGATKAFVLSFGEGLAREMDERGADGVRIVTLCPGGTQTNFGDGMLRGQFEGAKQDTPERVAEETLLALDRGDAVRVVGATNYAMTLAPRLLPRGVITKIAGDIFRPAGLARRSVAAPDGLKVLVGLAVVGLAAVLLLGARRRGDGR